jgi:hypothetical protein
MARQKPNKTSKPPNKRIEEQDKQLNTDALTNITPQSATARKKTTDTIEQSENPQTKPYRTPIQAIYVNKESIMNHMDKLERKKELKKQEEFLYQDDEESLRTVNKFEHEHNTEDTLTSPKMGDESSPNKSERKEAAQDSDASSPSTTTRQKTSHRQRYDAKMKKMFAALANSTKLQLKQQQ